MEHYACLLKQKAAQKTQLGEKYIPFRLKRVRTESRFVHECSIVRFAQVVHDRYLLLHAGRIYGTALCMRAVVLMCLRMDGEAFVPSKMHTHREKQTEKYQRFIVDHSDGPEDSRRCRIV